LVLAQLGLYVTGIHMYVCGSRTIPEWLFAGDALVLGFIRSVLAQLCLYVADTHMSFWRKSDSLSGLTHDTHDCLFSDLRS
jgi:hypothetical protein